MMNKTTRTVLDAQRCVWMDAGVLNYKLCERAFDCDNCPLDHVLRKEDNSASVLPDFFARKLRVERPLPPGATPAVEELLRPHSATELRSDLLYTSDYLWMRPIDGKSAFLGLTHFLANLFPTSSRIVFAPAASRLQHNRPFAWAYFDGGVIPLLSPFSGAVMQQNSRIGSSTDRLSEICYDLGWLVSIMPDDFEQEAAVLLTPQDLLPALSEAIDHLLQRSYKKLNAAIAESPILMNDGGTPVSTLYEALGGPAWANMLRSLIFPRDSERDDAGRLHPACPGAS